MRDAESTLDQLISFCGKEIAEADVLSMFGLAARSQILALAGRRPFRETEKALRQLNDLAHQGKDLGRLVSELAWAFSQFAHFPGFARRFALDRGFGIRSRRAARTIQPSAQRRPDAHDGGADRLRRPAARHRLGKSCSK
jgi:DNA polymerase III gamma/tau subunit